MYHVRSAVFDVSGDLLQLLAAVKTLHVLQKDIRPAGFQLVRRPPVELYQHTARGVLKELDLVAAAVLAVHLNCQERLALDLVKVNILRREIKDVFVNILSGKMIPLWFMPIWMMSVLKYTPFASIYFTPVQIYLGQLSAYEMLSKCLVQIVWIIVIFLIGNVLWNKGQKKLVVQGG